MSILSSILNSIPDPVWIIVGIIVTKSADGINAIRKDRIAEADAKSDDAIEERRLDFDIEQWKKKVSDDLLRNTQAALDRYKEDILEQNKACKAEIAKLNSTHTKEVERINKAHTKEIKSLKTKMENMRKTYVAELDARDLIIMELKNGIDRKPASL